MNDVKTINQAQTQDETSYERWQRQEGIRAITGFYLPDLKTVALDPWERMGGLGAFLNLEGTEDTNDAYVCEIPPGAALKPQRHLFEEMIYVLSGQGATAVWREPGKKHIFEWQAGSVFSIPLNTWYQHFSGRGDMPVRFVAVTSAPLVINLFHNLEFVFGCDFAFQDRFNGDPDHFSGKGTETPARGRARAIWETNFIPDVARFPLHDWKERGAGGRNAMLEIGNSTLTAHISEFPVGTYKKAHRHGPGAHVIIISGRGYSLMWREGEEKKKFDWQPGSIIVPPDRWFHQHFNTGTEPARYLALRWGSRKFPLVKMRFGVDRSVTEGGDQIEYADEDPEVHRLFERELAQSGLTSRMTDLIRRTA